MSQGPLRLEYTPTSLSHSALIVVWEGSPAQVGKKIREYLTNQLGGRVFCEIDPWDFFSQRGVSVEDSLIDFAESKFWDCQGIGVFESHRPDFEHFRFLNLVLDVAKGCRVNPIYTIEGMPSGLPHTIERRLTTIVNFPRLKKGLKEHNIETDSTFTTPPSQPPSLGSFLLWTAKRRRIGVIGLWVGVPFYLTSVGDPLAEKRVMEFLNQRHNWGISLEDLDGEIENWNEKLNRVRMEFPEVDRSIAMLERGVVLAEAESQELVREIEEFWKRGA